MFDGLERILLDIRYVLDLKRNLISLGVLDQIRCSVKAEQGCLKAIKGAMVIRKGIRQNGLLHSLEEQ